LSKLGLTGLIMAASAISVSGVPSPAAVEALSAPTPRPESPPDEADTSYQFAADIGVKFNGVLRPLDVLAYNVAEGWIDCGRFTQINGQRIWRRERGVIMTYRLKGIVEPFWRR